MSTIDDLMNSQKAFFTPGDVAGVLGCDPHSIRVTARQRPDLIRFPFFFSGSHMKIPRIPFLRFIGVDI